MINYNTILSSYDERGTLLKWLKTLNEALENGALSTVTTTTGDDYVIFHFTFADGTSVDSPQIPLEAGPKGDKGDKGDTGAQGPAATVAVGTVTTLPAGSDATVTNSGTSGAAVFDFGIPQGANGAAGGITDINNYTGAVTTGDGLVFDTLTGELSTYDFNLVNTGTVTMDFTGITTISKVGGDFNYAINADGSIGKIYGAVVFSVDAGVSGSTTVDIPTNLYVSAPDADYNINGGSCLTYIKSDDSIYPSTFYTPVFKIDTSGRVYVKAQRIDRVPGGKIFYGAPACIYFFKNFGDTPNNT